MATSIMLKHTETSLLKKGFYGFSWTTLFFGFFPALCRGDFVSAGIMIGIMLLSLLIFSFLGIFIYFVFEIIWSFIYNKRYTLKLISQGYELYGNDKELKAAQSALGILENQSNHNLNNTKLSKLEKLADLKAKGAITETEFEMEKQKIFK